jgi:hypothetical protein
MRRSAVAAIAAGLALLAGCGNGAPAAKPGGSPPGTQQPATGSSAPAANGGGTQTASSRPQQPKDPFWALIEQTRRAAGKDTGTQSQLLRDRLSKLAPAKIIEFEGWWQALDRRLYTWNVWGAAYVIEDGCSDDCFRNFRAYVILLGQTAFNRAAKNPDALAPLVSNSETGDWEGADNVAPDAYSSATGNDFPTDTPDLSGTPRGVPWSDNQLPALLHRYPKLAAKFR